MSDMLSIEVAYALEDVQYLFSEKVKQGTTVIEALNQSKLLVELPGLVIDKVGIFGKLVSYDTVLREGDRIEVYRPLKVDPRERRRQKVEEERKAAK
ncbi:RnfH family protein [Thiomicrorhabdus sp. Milos-T2]|uniref:RnfH family protein n=1 Tax=Thiomicrorhabdus sp. Milos-T2 TaxID=90814 RepID=UPI000AA3CDD7|nr:RnfH family protein [Thiomicrorhabdus sp. Milos-T2]